MLLMQTRLFLLLLHVKIFPPAIVWKAFTVKQIHGTAKLVSEASNSHLTACLKNVSLGCEKVKRDVNTNEQVM